MDVEEINTQRFEIALELFQEGHNLRFDGVNFWLAEDNYLNLQVESSWSIGDPDDERAFADLKRANAILNYLLKSSPEFAETVQGRSYRFSLIHFDGRDAVELGKFINNNIIWN